PSVPLYPLSLHDALPISVERKTRSPDLFSLSSYSATRSSLPSPVTSATANFALFNRKVFGPVVSHSDSANVSPSAFGSRTAIWRDRKSTRLNSSHGSISY